MTAALLVESIAAEIRAATAKLILPSEYHNEEQRRLEKTWKKIHVYEQYIPHDLFENDSYYPCCVVEWVRTKDNLRGGEIKSIATIALSCGVFAKEFDGWKDGLYLTEKIRQRLLSVRTIAQRFRLEDDIEWASTAPQPAPFFFTYAELKYEIYMPQEPFPVDRTMEPDLITVEPKKILKVDAFNRRIN